MKKVLYLVGMLMILTCFFAGSLYASNQFKTSVVPYSLFRYSSSSAEQETKNSDYGVGLKLSYLYTFNNGFSIGAGVGMLDYYLADEKNQPNVNGNCVVCPIYAKFGYYTPANKEKKVKYFVLGDIGLRLLHVSYEKTLNFSFGAELGLNVAIVKGLCIGASVEPEISFSNKQKTTTNIEHTDFAVSGSLCVSYEW